VIWVTNNPIAYAMTVDAKEFIEKAVGHEKDPIAQKGTADK
jgi:hypothetical protein